MAEGPNDELTLTVLAGRCQAKRPTQPLSVHFGWAEPVAILLSRVFVRCHQASGLPHFDAHRHGDGYSLC